MILTVCGLMQNEMKTLFHNDHYVTELYMDAPKGCMLFAGPQHSTAQHLGLSNSRHS